MRRFALVLAVLPLLAACNSTRPLPTVREHGERAFNRGQYEKARADFAEYVERNPGEPEIRLLLAKSLLALGNPAEAAEHASAAFHLRPMNQDAVETYARALFESKQTTELDRFLRAQAESNGSSDAYLRWGRYLAKSGDADGAEHALLRGAALDGGRTIQPQLALAEFYRSIGDKKNELRRLRTALSFDTANDAVNARIRELGEIPGPSLALPPVDDQPMR
ncbi:MAG: tetratricopeptide repeat protein [Phycisphaerae bacterium]|nr:tetratricopeptide repeat protein [Phycisphaerae bacterium]